MFHKSLIAVSRKEFVYVYLSYYHVYALENTILMVVLILSITS